MNVQNKVIELINFFPEITGQRREELAAAFSEAIEFGRKDQNSDLSDSDILEFTPISNFLESGKK
jgi:hypothetical protein